MKKVKVICSLALAIVMFTLSCFAATAAETETPFKERGFEIDNSENSFDVRKGVTRERSAEHFHNGAYSLKITQVENNEDNAGKHQAVSYVEGLTTNNIYKVSMWIYVPSALQGANTGVGAYVHLVSPAQNKQYITKVGEWTEFTYVFTWTGAANGVATFEIGFDDGIAAGSCLYVDDVKYFDITAQKDEIAKTPFNGGMEDITNWAVTGNVTTETGIVQKGEKSLKITGDGSALQKAIVSANAQILEGCVKTGAGYTNGDARINIYEGFDTTKLLYSKSLSAASVWKKVSTEEWTSSIGVITVELKNEGDAPVYFDTFILDESANMLSDGGFELGTFSLTNGYAAASKEDAHTGSYSIKLLEQRTSVTPIVYSEILAINGVTEYTLKYWYKATKKKVGVWLYGYNSENSETVYELSYNDVAASDGEWVEVNWTFKPNTDTSHFKVQFFTNTLDSDGTYDQENDFKVYIDDVALIPKNITETEFRDASGTALCELTAGTHTVTANYAVTAEEAGSCLYVVALYTINKENGVRNLSEVSITNPELVIGENQLTDTMTVTVADTETYRYEVKCYAWDGVNTLDPLAAYNDIRSN